MTNRDRLIKIIQNSNMFIIGDVLARDIVDRILESLRICDVCHGRGSYVDSFVVGPGGVFRNCETCNEIGIIVKEQSKKI